jgi:hypothetical protein
MAWILPSLAGFIGFLLVQYLRGARYQRWELVLGVGIGVALTLGGIAGISLLTAITGESQALWIALCVLLVLASAACVVLVRRFATHRKVGAAPRAPFDFSAPPDDHVTSTNAD